MPAAISDLNQNLYNYFLKNALRENEIVKALRVETEKLFPTVKQMQISPEEGQLMGLLIEILNARKTLEIGTFTGYSALVVALALPDDGKIISCDLNVQWTNMAEKFWEKAGVRHKIELNIAPAIDTLNHLLQNGEQNTFDFSFIDADKENYDHYYEKSLSLLRPGGLIMVDNVLWGGRVADLKVQDKDTRAIRALNEKIVSDERVTMSLLPIRDGVTLARKR